MSQTPDLENFASVYRSSKHVIDLARQGGRSELDNLDRRRSTNLTIPPSSDARPYSFSSSVYSSSVARVSWRRLIVVTAAGMTGASGVPGRAGATGLTGLEGRRGRSGATGATGQRGDTGVSGHTGHTGSTGTHAPCRLDFYLLKSYRKSYYKVTLTQPKQISHINVSVADLRTDFRFRFRASVSKLAQTWLCR